MLDLVAEEKENRTLIVLYVWLLFFLLALYLLTLVLGSTGYDPVFFRQGTMYFFFLQFLLFSMLIPFWVTGPEGISSYFRTLSGPLFFLFSLLPLVLVIFLAGGITEPGLGLALLLQLAWGSALLNLKKLLASFRISPGRQGLFLVLFIFLVLVFSSLGTCLYVLHAQSVITAVYDRDLPLVFFINPLTALGGVLAPGSWGESQMGPVPYLISLAFWVAFTGACAALSIFREGKKE